MLGTMRDLLGEEGELHVVDYGLQRSRLMRFAFRQTAQRLDGIEDTQPNAEGMLPKMISDTGFQVIETKTFRTVTGSITLFRGTSGEKELGNASA